ncbi:Precursor of CEP3 [Melia azedarach]|uniref:Precursor of CEP3 n=1 Tax=Melia azedarach TaxID=155640 RepID=A0ACC1XUV3_MELAZ|nr:Precursor of CEP3 [Melia azedarach]
MEGRGLGTPQLVSYSVLYKQVVALNSLASFSKQVGCSSCCRSTNSMAQIKLTFVCLLLVLIFCQEIQSIEGRNLKLERAKELPKLQTYKKIVKREAENISEHRNNLHGDKYPTVNASDAALSPPTAPTVGAGEALPPPPKSAENFRPTAPGHSPGVGHSLQN